MRVVATFTLLISLTGATAVQAADPPTLALANSMSRLRDTLGKPLLETVVSLNNTTALVLENLTPQGASFTTSGRKTPGESFDILRKRSYFAISFSTCSGAASLDAKISSVIAWQLVSPKDPDSRESVNYQGYTAAYLQQLLQLLNTPPAISNPSTLRAPRTNSLGGVVFEFVKGDTTETLSLIDDVDVSPDNALHFSWQAVNTSFCPKIQ